MHSVACMIRQAFRMLLKDDRVQLCPGQFSATFVKSEGRTLCQSAVVQAIPFFDEAALFTLAQVLRSGPGRTIQSWRVPFLKNLAPSSLITA